MPSVPAVRYDNRPTGGGGVPLPTSQDICWGAGTVIAGNPVYASHYQNPTPADGDTSEWDIILAPGNYTLSVLGRVDTINGIHDFYLDGVLVGTQDWYNVNFGSVTFTAPLTIVNQNSILRAVVNGKNPASTDFWYDIGAISIT